MDTKEKIFSLKEEIDCQLTPLITSDFIYIDLPYHNNIGDNLIWKGTKDFFQTLDYNCLCTTDCANFTFPTLPKDCVILLHGGGNFGDLYPRHNEFRKAVIAKYPNNKIVILPQTVYYEKDEHLKADSEFYSGRGNITICTRDTVSYSIAKDNFKDISVLLVPDMAFYINLSEYEPMINHTKGRTLYLNRTDKESTGIRPQCVPANAEEHDWPTLECKPFIYWLCMKGHGLLKRVPGADAITKNYADFAWQRILLPYNIKIGIKFLYQYEHVYTTRLHTAILSILLNRQTIIMLDNNNGKLQSFYETWLKDLDNLEYIKQEA